MGWFITKGYALNVSEQDVVEAKVKRALGKLFTHDLFLLQSDVNERSLSHKLAEYLQSEFEDWNVDCEYNRRGFDPKRLNLGVEQVRTDDTQGRTVYPDIVVHRRNSEDSLLVIEIKKSTNRDDGESDRDKLRAFKAQLGYRYALFIRLRTATETPAFEEFDFI
jgi:hypothetical protein